MDDGSSIAHLWLAQVGATPPVPGHSDDGLQTALLVLLTIFLVLLNGFFVATEFAIVKVRSTRIKELADGGNATAKVALRAIRQLDAYLSATQLGITMASLALGWVGEPVVSHRLVEPLLTLLGQQLDPGTIQLISFAIAFL
ncbi:MAG TPA: CNNM domain-containing protein, partial [Armatimonadota bacterium]|nr:CNNM domain-containing protein [Armatimonadota bacterium]